METPRSSNGDETPTAAKKTRETRRNVSVVLLAVAILVVGVACNYSGSLPQLLNRWGGGGAARDSSAPVDMPGSYVVKDDLCGAVDLEQYEKTVGLTAEVDTRQSKALSGPDGAHCFVSSGNNDAPISIHKLDMRSEVLDDRERAKSKYDDLQEKTKWGFEPESGPWEEGLLGVDGDTYVLVVRDENVVLIFYQHIDPFDEIEAEDAEELMNGYAQQILEYLHK